jgi:hypothetical protein
MPPSQPLADNHCDALLFDLGHCSCLWYEEPGHNERFVLGLAKKETNHGFCEKEGNKKWTTRGLLR